MVLTKVPKPSCQDGCSEKEPEPAYTNTYKHTRMGSQPRRERGMEGRDRREPQRGRRGPETLMLNFFLIFFGVKKTRTFHFFTNFSLPRVVKRGTLLDPRLAELSQAPRGDPCTSSATRITPSERRGACGLQRIAPPAGTPVA